MGGLLYKDFVSVGGKKLSWILVIGTVLFIPLRMFVAGIADNPDFMAEDANGDAVAILDMLVLLVLGTLIIGLVSLVNTWTGKIVEDDSKNKIREYIASLPVDADTYVASKYVFIGIAVYMFYSMEAIWLVTDRAFSTGARLGEIRSALITMSMPLMELVLFVAAVELPLYMLMGAGKAKLCRVSFWMVVGLAVIAFLLFGDLNKLDRMQDIAAWIEWLVRHNTEMVLLQALLSAISIFLYYLSYRFTCHFYRKELRIDE